MPYAGDTYSLPSGTAAVTLTAANSAHNNSRFNDLADAQNAVRPIARGGTGASTASGARTALGVPAATEVVKLATESQAAAGGVTWTAKALSISTGVLTVDVSDAALQTITNDQAFDLRVDFTKPGSCILLVTNASTAGAIDTSDDFGTNVDGDVYGTTNAEIYAFHIVVYSSTWASLSIRKKV